MIKHRLKKHIKLVFVSILIQIKTKPVQMCLYSFYSVVLVNSKIGSLVLRAIDIYLLPPPVNTLRFNVKFPTNKLLQNGFMCMI